MQTVPFGRMRSTSETLSIWQLTARTLLQLLDGLKPGKNMKYEYVEMQRVAVGEKCSCTCCRSQTGYVIVLAHCPLTPLCLKHPE